MSDEPSSADQAATPPQTSTEPLGEDTAHCRRMLLSLAEIGNELAFMIARQALAQEDNPAEARKCVATYNSVTQSVRRSVMLHDKLGKPAKNRLNRIAARKKIIRDVEDAIQSKAYPDEHEALHAEFIERLDRPDLEDDLEARPLGDIITDICRDLGVGLTALPGTHPWKRRGLHDIAIINARAAHCGNAAPSAELAALLATAPPPPPRRRDPLPDISKMSDLEIKTRLRVLGRRPDPPDE